MEKILELMLKRVETKLKNQNIKMTISKEAKEFLVKTGFDTNYGARPLQRTIQRVLEDPLAEDLIKRRFQAGSTIKISYDENVKKLSFVGGTPSKD